MLLLFTVSRFSHPRHLAAAMKYSNMFKKHKEKNEEREKSGVKNKIVKVNKGGKVCDRMGIIGGKGYTGV